MVKPSKSGGRRPTPDRIPQSAFAVYKSVPTNQQDINVDQVPSRETQDGVKNSPSFSSGVVKQKSSRTHFPFRHSLKKKAKKLRKNLEASQAGDGKNGPGKGTHTDDGKGSQSAILLDKALTKQVNASHLMDNHKTAKLKSASRLQYKSSYRSVELSTSHSLTGFEDDTNEGPSAFNENRDPNSNGMDFATKTKVSSTKQNQIGKVIPPSGLDEDQPNGTSSGTGQSNSKHKTPSSGPISVRKATGKVLRMPAPTGDSEEDSKSLFNWLIHPMTDKPFMSTIWEKKPALIRRRVASYASGIFSTDDFNKMLHECNVQYGVNLDVTSYQDGVRQTHNVEGRVYPTVAWDYYKNGCSLRLKNPQAFSKPVWRVCATLQEYFKNMVGANMYLTPPGTQGFAPHYDDIEAFVLQLEGKKHWRLYNPVCSKETLPRYSSGNFKDDEIGDQIFDAVLEPGDLLYFPRGFIHQAQAVPNTHSLHITISTYQRNSWADALEDLLPKALEKAVREDMEFRKGLPVDYSTCFGYQNRDHANPARRKQILTKVADLIHKLADYVDVDDNADVRAKSFLYDALPPVLSQEEMGRCIQGAPVKLSKPGVPSSCQCGVDMDTEVRIVRKNSLRIMRSEDNDDDDFYIFHCVQNPRTYHTEEQKFFVVTKDCVPTVEYLIHSYPEFKSVRNMPLSSDADKMNVIGDLLEKGVLLTKKNLDLVDGNDCISL